MAETRTDEPAGEVNIGSAAKKPEPVSRAPKRKEPDKGGFYWGLGRRKSSIARVRIKPGEGKLLINKRQLGDYFAREQDRKSILSPLKSVDAEKSFDVFVNVRGGGTSGQAGATVLGIARALVNYDENYVHALREGRYLTRDGRMVERKKPGQKGARKRFQFSKR